MTRYYTLEQRSKLVDNYRKAFFINNRDLLLLQHQGELYLLENICPHAGYPMTDGVIIGTDLRCPMHGYLFNLQSGDCTFVTEGPCRGLHTYSVVIKPGEVGVML